MLSVESGEMRLWRQGDEKEGRKIQSFLARKSWILINVSKTVEFSWKANLVGEGREIMSEHTGCVSEARVISCWLRK